MKKSDKLLKLKVELGGAERSSFRESTKWYEPKDLIGKKVILVSNLAPAKLRGEMSEGMILAADNGDAARVFLGRRRPTGSKIR